MPTVKNAHLTLTTVGADTTINVKYDAEFIELERHLAKLGIIFAERISIRGVDSPKIGLEVVHFTSEKIPLTDGNETVTIARSRSRTVPRASLQEDPDLGDNDEIIARIRIGVLGLPPAETPDVFTNQQVLVG